MCASGLPTPLHSTSCSSSFQDLDFISRLILRFWIMYQLLQQTPSNHRCFLTYLVQWFFTRGMRFLQSSQQKPPFQASFLTLPGSDSLAALYSRRSDTELLQPQLRVWLSNEKPASHHLLINLNCPNPGCMLNCFRVALYPHGGKGFITRVQCLCVVPFAFNLTGSTIFKVGFIPFLQVRVLHTFALQLNSSIICISSWDSLIF